MGAWPDRVLITGGAGLVGSHIADALVATDAVEIVILDNFSRGRRENLQLALESRRVRVVEGDHRDPDDVARAMDGVGLVFHQAAIRIPHGAQEPRRAKAGVVDRTFY